MIKKYAVSDFLEANDIKVFRKKYHMTQAEFAELVNVSKKTIERWEGGDKKITGPIVTLVKVLNENPDIEENLQVPEQKFPLRMWYMYKNDICAVIDVDELNQRIKVKNYARNLLFRPFGRNSEPTFADYEEFLESRCFPRTRDKMKLVLADLGVPYYDPFLIIKKTQGRMAEDNFWIKM